MALDTNDPVVARTLKHMRLDRSKLSEALQIMLDEIQQIQKQASTCSMLTEEKLTLLDVQISGLKESILYLASKIDSGVLGTDNEKTVLGLLK